MSPSEQSQQRPAHPLSRATIERWDAAIKDRLKTDVEFHRQINSLLLGLPVGVGSRLRLPFRECLRDTFDGLMHTAWFEPLDLRGQAMLAARILRICIKYRCVERPGLNQHIGDQTEGRTRAVREIRKSFSDKGREFQQAILDEYVAQFSK